MAEFCEVAKKRPDELVEKMGRGATRRLVTPTREDRAVINRAAIILRYKEPAIRWLNEADPYHDDPGMTAEDVNRERTVYLISDEDADADAEVERWVKSSFKVLFETELEGWYSDPSLWPKKLTLKLFREWFDVECNTVLIDTVGGPIHDDGL